MGLYIALLFLTRIPLPQISIGEKKIARSLPFFPIVGYIIGLLLYIIYLVTKNIFYEKVVFSLVIIAHFLLTGGMHLDGFADTMDGFFCGKPREKKLEIMRDSNIGAFGATSICLLIMLKYILISSLSSGFISRSLLLSPVFGRWAMTFSIIFLPYARKKGLGGIFTKYKEPGLFVLSTLVTIILGYIHAGVWGIIGIFVVFLGCILFSNITLKHLNGMTGDTYGALCEVCEVVALLFFSFLSFKGGF